MAALHFNLPAASQPPTFLLLFVKKEIICIQIRKFKQLHSDREADPLEIFTDREGEIILKKYSPIGEMGTFAKQYAESMAQVSGHVAMISDRDQFIAVAGGMKNMLGKSISRELEEKIDHRESVVVCNLFL